MSNKITLDQNHSTTRMLTTEKPIVINGHEYKFETILFLPEGRGRKGEGRLRTKEYFKKSYGDKSLVGIITVVFNGEQYLEQMILSGKDKGIYDALNNIYLYIWVSIVKRKRNKKSHENKALKHYVLKISNF